MARKSRVMPRFDTSMYAPTEDVLLKPIPIGGFKGMDKQSPLISMDPEKLRLVRNMLVRYGAYKTRDGTELMGTIATSNLLYATDVILPDGTYYLVRWRVDGVDVYYDGAWHTIPSDFTGSENEPFAITGWINRVIFTAGNGRRLFELFFDTAGISVSELGDSPTGIVHLATFNQRVVASRLEDGSVLWSVAKDHTDWSGLGSGEEDLLSAPGGKPDDQTAVVAVSDHLAYCVRSQSVWQIRDTGDFDAPFEFTRLYTYVGSRWPMTVTAIPNGFIAMGDAGQIWKVTSQGYMDVSEPIHDDLSSMDQATKRTCCATYDLKFDEYRLTRLDAASTTAQRILRYSVTKTIWTEDVYPFPVKSISYAQFAKILTADELMGTVDALVGSADDLGVGSRSPGAIYAASGASRLVIRDDSTKNAIGLRDVNYAGVRVASGFRMESGDIRVSDPIKRQEFAEMICYYETDDETTLDFDYSYDGGVVWNVASQQTVQATLGRPRPMKVQRTADRPFLQFAVSAEAAPNVRIIGFQAMMREGARTVDTTP